MLRPQSELRWLKDESAFQIFLALLRLYLLCRTHAALPFPDEQFGTNYVAQQDLGPERSSKFPWNFGPISVDLRKVFYWLTWATVYLWTVFRNQRLLKANLHSLRGWKSIEGEIFKPRAIIRVRGWLRGSPPLLTVHISSSSRARWSLKIETSKKRIFQMIFIALVFIWFQRESNF